MPLFFAITLFVSASLLFFVQPMIAKMILPTLGGTPAVWNTCMVFFQAALLVGYAYAHFGTTLLGVRRQAGLHVVLLLLPFLVLPISIAKLGTPPGDANPIPWVLMLLAVSTGLPFFVVSASAPLLQKWFADTGHPAARDPYFLYAASNLGSMLALLGYPILVEPYLPVSLQSLYWAIGYGVLVALTICCAVLLWRSPKPDDSVKAKFLEAIPDVTETLRTVDGRTRLWWIALALVPSSLMLGVTTYISTDIAAIPLLWVVPLALYLLSFIIVFAKMPPWFDKLLTVGLLAGVIAIIAGFYYYDTLEAKYLAKDYGYLGKLAIALIVAVGAAFIAIFSPRVPPLLTKTMILLLPLIVLLIEFMYGSGKKPGIVMQVLLYLCTLFVVAMVCHGELARSRPPTKYLTEFYLLMSLGGVLGGLLNALVAPLVFTTVAELPLALTLACILLPRLDSDKEAVPKPWLDFASAAALIFLAAALVYIRWHKDDAGSNQEFLDKLTTVFNQDRLRVLAVAGVGALAILIFIFQNRENVLNRVMDVVVAIGMGALAFGLFFGLSSSAVGLDKITEYTNTVLVGVTKWFTQDGLRIEESNLRMIIMYGLPPLLCYTLIARPVRFGLAVGAVFITMLWCDDLEGRPVVHRDRSFFGTMAVKDLYVDGTPFRELMHGTTLHGMQSLDPNRRRDPVTYYHPTGPIGQIFNEFSGPKMKKNIAVVGLGTGTLATYGQAGQNITFYEIDPTVVRLSGPEGEYFTFVKESPAKVNIVLGDARLRLKEAPDHQYDLIFLDAFSSDAIPAHLITLQALQMYLTKLSEDGIIVFHISNRYLNLEPVLGNLAKEVGLAGLLIRDDDDGIPEKSSSHWVLLSRKAENFGKLAEDPRWKPLETNPDLKLWTDDFTNILSIFDWK